MESNQIKAYDIEDYVIFGELSLLGELKSVRGTIPIIIEGDSKDKHKFIFPHENLDESLLVDQTTPQYRADNRNKKNE